MAGSNLNFPYDAEIFNYSWKNTPDIVLTSMLTSGAVVNDAEIANLISNGSNFFTTPYYDVLSGTEDVYNGVNSFTGDELAGGTYAGVVFGRMASWSAKSFIKDFNSGADPMAQIVDGVAQFWIKARQTRLLGILGAVFGITGDSDWDLHTNDISSAGVAQIEQAISTGDPDSNGNITMAITAAGMTNSPKDVVVAILATDDAAGVAVKVITALGLDADVSAFFTIGGTGANVEITTKTIAAKDATIDIGFTDTGSTNAVFSASTDETTYVAVVDANKIGVTSINDTIIDACGDNAGGFSMAIMHSVVANKLANLQLLEYSKYTDAAGITRALPLATINGMTVVINDLVPRVAAPVLGEYEYTTYIFGDGAIRYATAPVDVPSEMDRDPNTNGGVDMIYTRIRECFAPYGFSFKGDATTDVGVPDAVLTVAASWERKMPAKTIKMAQLVTNG